MDAYPITRLMTQANVQESNISVLYVEDDASLSMVTADALKRRGYKVIHCRNGVEAIDCFLKGNVQVCLIDVLLPDIDGHTLSRVIRSNDAGVPIIFLSGKSEEADRLEGYKAWGDDFVHKPYSIEEIIYKIEVYSKRTAGNANLNNRADATTIGSIRLDAENLLLICGDHAAKITLKEADLLGFMMRHKNKLLKRNEILFAVWGKQDDKTSRSLDVFISRLRKYLQVDRYVRLESHKGVGYKLSELN